MKPCVQTHPFPQLVFMLIFRVQPCFYFNFENQQTNLVWPEWINRHSCQVRVQTAEHSKKLTGAGQAEVKVGFCEDAPNISCHFLRINMMSSMQKTVEGVKSMLGTAATNLLGNFQTNAELVQTVNSIIEQFVLKSLEIDCRLVPEEESVRLEVCL
ncbi:uncharacterized protein [Branchiostoma lanceolatum]|uniref:uncharacterized protein n=1 Tax=Branchiostoma lanceolatum TaxID=7740 RepID=UPI0034537ED6